MRLVLSVIVLCIMAIALPEVSSQPPPGKGRKGQSPTVNTDPEVWTIAFGLLGTREEYLDPISGQIRGFNVDIVNAVCEIAGKNCQMVQDPYSNCWASIEGGSVGGVGLFNFYYDACTGWFQTLRRLRTFAFSTPFAATFKNAFAVIPGNPTGFDAGDLTDRKIGFLNGYASDPSCLARQDITGAALPDENIVIYNSESDFLAGIANGEVDAGFNSVLALEALGDQIEIVQEGEGFSCSEGGSSMMGRKDNPFFQWFDSALEELLASPEYREICDNLVTEHGDIPGPEPDAICLDY